MIAAYFAYQFAGLWALLWQFGVLGVLAIGCFAAAYFSPIFKKDFIWAGVVFVSIIATLATGVSLGEKRVHAQWDAARASTLENAKVARTSAVRSVARKPSRFLPARKDPYLRD